MSNPVLTVPGLVARYTRQIDLQFRDTPEVAAWQVYGHHTLNDAYGNPDTSGVGGSGPLVMFTVRKSAVFASDSVRRKGGGLWGENTRGTARALFDVEDFMVPANPVPVVALDDQWLYLRVQQNRVAAGGLLVVPGGVDAGDPILGPLYLVPPPAAFGSPEPSLTLNGTAPSNTGCTLSNVPAFSLDGTAPGPLHIVFPRPLSYLRLQNTKAAGGPNLLFCYGPGQSMQRIAPGEETVLYSGQTKDLLLAREAGNGGCTFDLTGTLRLGQ